MHGNTIDFLDAKKNDTCNLDMKDPCFHNKLDRALQSRGLGLISSCLVYCPSVVHRVDKTTKKTCLIHQRIFGSYELLLALQVAIVLLPMSRWGYDFPQQSSCEIKVCLPFHVIGVFVYEQVQRKYKGQFGISVIKTLRFCEELFDQERTTDGKYKSLRARTHVKD